VVRALQQTQNLAFPMYLMQYSQFKAAGKLIMHEEARARGLLRGFDSVQDIHEATKQRCIIFISHEWIGQVEPDFDSQHFHCICSSIEALQEKIAQAHDVNNEGAGLEAPYNGSSQWWRRMQTQDPNISWATPETSMHTDILPRASKSSCHKASDKSDGNSKDADTWLWIGCTSVPQRMTTLRQLSTHSLFIYAGLSTYFLILTPPVKNLITGQSFNLETYLLQGLCRLECWARFSQSVDNAFVVLGSAKDFQFKKVHYEPSVFQNCMAIFTANFADEQEKKKLVDTTVALYWQMLQRRNSPDSQLQTAFAHIQASKDVYFPRSYFGDLIEIAEELAQCADDVAVQVTPPSECGGCKNRGAI